MADEYAVGDVVMAPWGFHWVPSKVTQTYRSPRGEQRLVVCIPTLGTDGEPLLASNYAMPASDVRRAEDDDYLEDVAWLRMIGDSGRRYPLDEVAAGLGIEDDDDCDG